MCLREAGLSVFVSPKGLLRVGLECVLYFLPCLSR
jgi:hypothetical protein